MNLTSDTVAILKNFSDIYVTNYNLPTKKLDTIIYYERYVVINAGDATNAEGEPLQYLDFLTRY